jgi:predicted RNA-binding Zn ribbon-like protein
MSNADQWFGDLEAKPAPGPLRRVQGFINTLDRESGQDRLAAQADAQPWLVSNGLLSPGDPLTADDLHVLVDVREGLRGLVIHNTGGPLPDAAATAPLRRLTEEVSIRASVGDDGLVTVGPVGDTVRARLTGLLLIVEAAQRDGTWAHLKACANDDCLWAFYDRSRNHGGTWCDMASCGNKLKNRDFRARKRVTR